LKKIAAFVFADTQTHEGLGRVVNALETVKEFKVSGDDVRLYFDGTGTKWPAELAKPDHIANPLYESVKDMVEGACHFCARAFNAEDSIRQCKIEMVSEFENHISIKKLVSDGYQIMNF
jgi:hypothetical protein